MEKLDFIHLSWIFAPRLAEEESSESQRRETLFGSMSPLKDQDDSNIDFISCSSFADRDISLQNEVCQFERCRILYLQSVLQEARLLFKGTVLPEQNFYQHAKERLRAIDPDLLGESRYEKDDCTLIKICKTMYFAVSRQLYSWVNDEISAWKTRCEVFEWGATQNPHTVIYPRVGDLGVKQEKEPLFSPKTVTDSLIRDVFIEALGFRDQDTKALQSILGLLPGMMRTASYDPKTREAQFTLEKKWIGRPNWKEIDQHSSKPIPQEIAPISMLLSDLQSSGAAIPDILKTVGNRLAVVPRNARLEMSQTVKGTVEKDSDGISLKIPEGMIRVVIPARFGFFSPEVYVDLTEFKRFLNGEISLTLKAGGSTGFDTTIKGLAVAVTKIFFEESSTTVKLPISGKMRLPDESELEDLVKKAKYIQWGS